MLRSRSGHGEDSLVGLLLGRTIPTIESHSHLEAVMPEQLEFPIPPPVRLAGTLVVKGASIAVPDGPLVVHASLGRARIEEPPDDPPRPGGWLNVVSDDRVIRILTHIGHWIGNNLFNLQVRIGYPH